MIGKRIAKFRKEKGLTQADLAKVTRLSRGYISSIEEGRNPSIKAVVLIADALGVEARDLLEKNI